VVSENQPEFIRQKFRLTAKMVQASSNSVFETQNRANTACTGQVRAFARTFREAAPRGGFGVWWFFPPNPALAGNASRWAHTQFTLQEK
jgi:hypothetical protein